MPSTGKVCERCGAAVAQSDRFCSQCGHPVRSSANEYEDTAAANSGAVPLVLRCTVCGQENARQAAHCEACGAKLSGASPSVGGRQRSARRGKASGARRVGRTPRRLEPWQLAAAGLLLCAVVFFAYTELKRPQPVAQALQSGQADPVTDFTGMEQEIGRLQQIVDANPSDHESLLRLANMLHDAGIRDPQYLLRAIDSYKKYLTVHSANAEARVDLGICYFELARRDTVHSAQLYATAIREMEAAITEHPSHQAAAFNLGVVNLHAGNLEKSTKWFKRAVEIDPRTPLASRARELSEQHSF